MTLETPDKAPAADSDCGVSVQTLNEAELDALIDRISEAKTHDLALSAADYDVLLSALSTLASMQERLSHNDLTLGKMKKLLGMVNSSEKLKDLRPASADTQGKGSGRAGKKSRSKKAGQKRRPRTARIKPTVHHHALADLAKGDSCPSCSAGKVYKYQPALLLRITGHSPYSSEQHVSEQLRCNGCGDVFTAELPAPVKADGRADQQYGYSARAMMCINRYFGGTPFNRQESLQQLFGAPVASSTIYDQCEKVADALHPVFKRLKTLSADAHTYYLDDTTNRILNKVPIEKTRDGRTQWRSGVYTSACLALVGKPVDGESTGPPENQNGAVQRVVLFQTNIGHAGEWLDEILRMRDESLALPLLMSDALSSNHVTEVAFNKALCNAHARRGFAELAAYHPDEVLYALETYAPVWVNESHCATEGYSADARCAWHREHSLPQMEQLKRWCETETAESGKVEPNSNLGKAMLYFIRHYDGLTAFCRVPGAPVDNNEIERLIKLIVRGRKNSLFHKTQVGAGIADVIVSVLATCQENGVNAFDYLQSIQRNQLAVKASPEKWLPWLYPQGK